MRTVTSTTLLVGLRDAANAAAWKRFMERYEPMIVAFARRQGLSASDAEDVAQETVMAFVQSYGQGGYEREKGRLRSWLFRIAYYKAIDVLRRRVKENVVSARADGTAILKSIPSQESAEQEWEQEWKRFTLRDCLQEVKSQVQPKTYQAFELYVLQEWPVETVAERLGLSENAVYIAKNRVVSRVRELWPQIEEIW